MDNQIITGIIILSVFVIGGCIACGGCDRICAYIEQRID